MYEQRASATNPKFPQPKLREFLKKFSDIRHNYKDAYCQFMDRHPVVLSESVFKTAG
jgi:hypothetical protein